MKYLDSIRDLRADSLSILAKMKASDYIALVETAYASRGNLKGQRAPLRTKSAQTVRKRMIQDISRKAIIPPIVIGVCVDKPVYDSLNIQDDNSLNEFVANLDRENLSIIDGMQRTTALIEVGKELLDDYEVRVEFWVACVTNNLIYRMLVLNSGQIPWDLSRQLEVIFGQLKKELTEKVPELKLNDRDSGERRKEAGEYRTSDFIELYIVFGVRRAALRLSSELAEEFSRLDLMEICGEDESMTKFVEATKLMIKLDTAFAKLERDSVGIELKTIKDGFSIFSSQPARAGFMAAFSQAVYGIPGVKKSVDEQNGSCRQLSEVLNSWIDSFPTDPAELAEMLDLGSLDERMRIKTTAIGDFQRNYFLAAFSTLFNLLRQGQEVKTLGVCWKHSF